MKYKDLLDIHTHTLASGHAYNTVYEMADYGKELGMEILGISEHAPKMPGSCHHFYFDNLRVMPRLIHGQKMMFGVELNIMDREGNVDILESTLERLDYSLASMHTPCFKDERTVDNVMAGYEAICKNPYVTVIGHPDDGRFPIDHEELVLMAKEGKKLIEINNNSLNPDGFRPNTRENSRQILNYCVKHQVPVILNSDAHICIDLMNHQFSWDLINEVQFPAELIVNGNIELFLSYLRPKKQEYLSKCWSGEIVR